MVQQQFAEERATLLEEVGESYRIGLELFQSGETREAEALFVNTVRPFLSKNTMQSIYVKVEDFAPELLNTMYHIGLIYLQDNENTYSDSYSKAAAIFQYCHKFKEKYLPAAEEEVGKVDFLREAYLAEKKFLDSIKLYVDEATDATDATAEVDIVDSRLKEAATEVDFDVVSPGSIKVSEALVDQYYESKIEEYKGYKEELAGIREEAGALLLSISGFSMEQIGERAKAIEDIYKRTTDFFVSSADDSGLVQRLIIDCQEQLGPAPCEYSIVGLGSLAAGKMTPWSDLEFAIITGNDNYKDSKNPDPVRQQQEKEYFRNLTKLLHIKITNFGETPLRSVGIESFNNFKTGEEGDDWFWDECITSGFSFDGPHWHACKTPLGRQSGQQVGEGGGYRVKKLVKDEETGIDRTIIETKPDFELIMTPEQLASFQLEGDTSKLVNHRGETIVTREELLGTRTQVDYDTVDESESELEYAEEAEPYMVDGYLAAMEEQRDGWFGSDTHLVQGLRSTSLIGGTAKAQDLLDQYRERVREQDKQIGQNGQEGSVRELVQRRSLELLAQNIDDFQLKLGDEEEGKLLDIKKSIYRIADRIITELANYYGIVPKPGEPLLTSWQIIDRMESEDNPQARPLLSTEGAQHLKEALSIAAELRLATYSHNKGQLEGISTYVPAVEHLTEAKRKELIEETFHLGSTELLHHFYQIMFRVQNVAKVLSSQEVEYQQIGKLVLQADSLFDASDHTKGLIHARFLEYESAISCLEDARKQRGEDMYLLNSMYFLYSKLGIVDENIEVVSSILELLKTKHQDHPCHPDIASSYNNLGAAYSDKGEFDKAIELYDIALKIMREIYASNPSHPDIASSYNNLGNAYNHKGEFDKAVELFDRALKIKLEIYASHPNHSDIASSYNNLGNAYSHKGEYDKAIELYDRALKIMLEIYASNPNHPDIASSYNNLGNAYNHKGEYDKAIELYDRALKIRLEVYASNPNHPDIAMSYNNLGLAYSDKGEYDKAIELHDRALKIRLEIYASNPNHPGLAMSYNNLGLAYSRKGEFDRAVENSQIALSMYSLYSNAQYINIARFNYEFNIKQLSIELYLKGDFIKSKECLIQLDKKYSELDFNSQEFLFLLLNQAGAAYKRSNTGASLNCQKVLLKLDPEMQYGNHYHNLACFYSVAGEIAEANAAFNLALKAPHVSTGLRAEYSQFLIMHSGVLTGSPQGQAPIFTEVSFKSTVRECLHFVVSNTIEKGSGLQYGKLEQDSVCNGLSDIIATKRAPITLSPKTLAYYLLIKHPEYMETGVEVAQLLSSFEIKCIEIQDEVAFRLLSEAYYVSGDEELGLKYLKAAELQVRMERIANSTLPREDLAALVSNDLEDILANIPQLEKTALILVQEQKLKESVKIYRKIFTIYQSLISAEIIEASLENMEHYKLATNNLATISLLTKDINLFAQLKLGRGAEINPELVAAAGANIEQISDLEKAITTPLQAELSEEQHQVQTETFQSEEQEAESTDTVAKLGENPDMDSAV